MSESWFQATFGFTEKHNDFEYNRNQFKFETVDEAGNVVMTSGGNGEQFFVGRFETVSVQELWVGVNTLMAAAEEEAQPEATPEEPTSTSDEPSATAEAPPAEDATSAAKKTDDCAITFGHVCGCDVRSLIRDPCNEGAVFQVASQFNCLEMVGPGVKPEEGISKYALDPTQGPACALACPAGTAYRNYFAGSARGKGQGGGNSRQLNTASGVEAVVNNEKHKYWSLKNGYLLPTTTSTMADFTTKVKSAETELGKAVIQAVQVGVHWNTEVHTSTKHRVGQVFASAVPVAYAKSTKSTDWALLASLILDGMYEATLLVAAIVALEKRQRVTVYLTSVGGSAFGNRKEWILRAMARAVNVCQMLPIDVRLVHYGSMVPSAFNSLPGVPKKAMKKPIAYQDRK